MGIHKSFTDTWMQKLETRPQSSISGNIRFKFLVQCNFIGRQIMLLLAAETCMHGALFCWKVFFNIENNSSEKKNER